MREHDHNMVMRSPREVVGHGGHADMSMEAMVQDMRNRFLVAAVLSVPLLLTAFVLIGFATGPLALVLAHGRSLVPPHLLGRAITLLNIGAMGGGFLVQFVSGAIIEMFVSDGGTYPLTAYRLVFGLQAVLVLIGLIVYFRSHEKHLGAGSALR